MVKLAVADGSGSIGGAIIQALEQAASHEFVVLSRQHSADPRVVTVEFTNTETLQGVLEQHEVQTIISAVSLQSDA